MIPNKTKISIGWISLVVLLLTVFLISNNSNAAPSPVLSKTIAPTSAPQSTKKPCPSRACCVALDAVILAKSVLDLCMGPCAPWEDAWEKGTICKIRWAQCFSQVGPSLSAAMAIAQATCVATEGYDAASRGGLIRRCDDCYRNGNTPGTPTPSGANDLDHQIGALNQVIASLLRENPGVAEKTLLLQSCISRKVQCAVDANQNLDMNKLLDIARTCEESSGVVEACQQALSPEAAPTAAY